MALVQWDFDSIKARITARLRATVSFSEVLNFSTNARFIDAMSEELNYLSQYVEYLTRESKWDLAQNPSSLIAMQGLHRYQASRKIGATGVLRVGVSSEVESADYSSTTTYAVDDTVFYNDVIYKSIQASNTGHTPDSSPTYWTTINIHPSNNVQIPKYTQFSNDAGVRFTSVADVTLTTSDNFVEADIVQGEYKSSTFTAVGDDNEEFEIDNDSIENTYLEVTVNSITWTKVSNLLAYGATDQVYEIENKPDFSGIYIKFGNDIYGKKLTASDIVVVKYVETLGASGNILSSANIQNVDSVITDITSAVVDVYCNNYDTVLGGDNEEDIESIRLNAPNFFQAGGRATTNTDYKTIMENNFSYVLKSNIWGAYETNIDAGNDPWTYIPTEDNVVHVAAITTSGENLSAGQKANILASINANKSPTDIVQFEDVNIINMIFDTAAYVSNHAYTLATVKANIDTALENTYGLGNIDFFEHIYFSDYQRLIDSVAGVDYHNTTVKFYNDASFSSAYILQSTLYQYPIKEGSIEIYVRNNTDTTPTWVLVGTDNSSGSFTAETGYTLTGSSVDYENGTYIINVASGLSDTYSNYETRAIYQCRNNNLILTERNNIFEYDASASTITTEYI